MQAFGVMHMPRGGFNSNLGRPSLGLESMVSKGVHLAPSMWRDLQTIADEETKANTDAGEPQIITRADIIRRAVTWFLQRKGADAVDKNSIPIKGVIVNDGVHRVYNSPAHASAQLPFEVGPNSYALLVAGKEIESDDGITIPSDHYAIFSSMHTITPGALVDVTWKNEKGEIERAFKKYVPRPDGSAIFRPVSSSPEHQPVTRAAGDFDIQGAFVRTWDGKGAGHLQ